MARVEYPSIDDIVTQTLREVEADEVKTASAEAPSAPAPIQTELAGELRKLASVCRQQPVDVTYDDLQEFLNAK